jgi:hypothetical protein
VGDALSPPLCISAKAMMQMTKVIKNAKDAKYLAEALSLTAPPHLVAVTCESTVEHCLVAIKK